MDFSNMTNEALAESLATLRKKADALLTLADASKIEETETVVATARDIEAEQRRRSDEAKETEARFAAARESLAALDAEDESDEEDDAEDESDEDSEGDDSEDNADEGVEAAADDAEVVEASADDSEDDSDEESDDEGDVVTASASRKAPAKTAVKGSVASRVGRKTARPDVKAASPVVITAAADIPNVPMGSQMSDLTAVAAAAKARAKGFPTFNVRAAEAARSASNGQPVLNKFAVASFNLDFADEHKGGKGGKDYDASKAAVKTHNESIKAGLNAALSGKADTLTAAGWCAPSPYVYNWIADYVVDGLATRPEIDASRGGIQITQGPQLAQGTYADVDDFGFGGTEAEAIAGYTKTCETIECPEFEDHRLDFTGYCWKIPILTEHAYPELIADAMRLSDVLYAHKMNKRFITDVIAGSTAKTANGLGASVADSLEGLVQVAVKERRWWNIGENAVMEVKLPQIAREIFKFDMMRRSGLALNDVATDQKIAAYFANHNLSVEYVSDFEDVTSGTDVVNMAWPETIRAIIYPSGTWAQAVDDVINLSAVYDSASLSANEYTGVFFEQGVMTVKLGYRSHVVTIPVCTAGATGANIFNCEGSF